MAKAAKLSGSALVSNYIEQLEEPQKSIVEALREIIMGTDAEIAEEIKWNAPSFYYSGEMKAFDPKTYKRHIIVMNLHKRVLMVFPHGAKIDNTAGILTGDYADGRRLVDVKSLADAAAIAPALKAAINDWLSKLEK